MWSQLEHQINLLHSHLTLEWQLMPLRRKDLRRLSDFLQVRFCKCNWKRNFVAQSNCAADTDNTPLAQRQRLRDNDRSFASMVYFAGIVFTTIGYGSLVVIGFCVALIQVTLYRPQTPRAPFSLYTPALAFRYSVTRCRHLARSVHSS